jgi:uncharacterized protein YndB with AHSA1/START domain
MRSPESVEYRARGVYRGIDTPARLVFTFAWETSPEQTGHETLVTPTFAARGDKTELTCGKKSSRLSRGATITATAGRAASTALASF